MKCLSEAINNSKMWAEVKDYEGHYIVSNTGDVFSLDRIVLGKDNRTRVFKGVEISSCEGSHGYLTVALSKDGVAKAYSVHRLVAEAFLSNPDNLPQVNHKNKDKLNNHLHNLEWCTGQHNSEHALSKHYVVLTPDGVSINVYNLHKFCKENSLNSGTMYRVASGKHKHHAGYKVWRVEDE